MIKAVLSVVVEMVVELENLDLPKKKLIEIAKQKAHLSGSKWEFLRLYQED